MKTKAVRIPVEYYEEIKKTQKRFGGSMSDAFIVWLTRKELSFAMKVSAELLTVARSQREMIDDLSEEIEKLRRETDELWKTVSGETKEEREARKSRLWRGLKALFED